MANSNSEEIHGFEKEFNNSKECYPEVIPLLEEHFGAKFVESPKELDKKGSDLFNGIVHIDVKYNWQYFNRNFIVEYPSSHGKGWLFSEDSITDYLLWWTKDIISLIEFRGLQSKCIENEEAIRQRFGTMKVTSEEWGQKWRVDISKVPMHHIQRHIVKEWVRQEREEFENNF